MLRHTYVYYVTILYLVNLYVNVFIKKKLVTRIINDKTALILLLAYVKLLKHNYSCI